jgi:pilus assembly protein CpaF
MSSTYRTLRQRQNVSLPADVEQQLIDAAAHVILREHGVFPPEDAAGLRIAGQVLQTLIQDQGLAVPLNDLLRLKKRVLSELSGYGFLDQLLPPERTDLQEIVLTSQGQVFVRRKQGAAFEPLTALQVTPDEAWRVTDALLGPQSKALNEATPSVDARLPPTPHNPGGGRLKFLHPVLTGDPYPTLNLRLYEPQAPQPAQLVAWEMATEELLAALGEAVRRKLRVMIGGGTSTGKTTFLSALCAYLPDHERIVKLEDPTEIFLDKPHVQDVEARPVPPGSDVPPYTIADGVDDALRMAPDRLIVGEVRTGRAALALFRAQMSDHPGLTTFHAESPAAAAHRLAVIMFADAQVRFAPAKRLFVQAVDVYVQLHFDAQGIRRVHGVWEIAPELQGGDVQFRPIFAPGFKRVGEFQQRRTYA